jgi:hypothetical protein
VLVLSFAGCSSHVSALDVVARDSAGVRIVTTTVTAGGKVPEYRLARRPFILVGETLGDPHHELYRVTDAKLHRDGRLLVANAGEELLVYSSEGQYLSTIGRQGAGPGEFTRLWNVFSGPDGEVTTFDAATRRLATFRIASGALVGERTLDVPLIGLPNGIGLLDDGIAVGFAATHNVVDALSSDTSRAPLVRFGLHGAVLDTVDLFPGSVFRRTPAGTQPVVFSPGHLSATSADHVYAGWTGRYQISVYDNHGTLVRIVRTSLSGGLVTDAMKDAAGRVYREGGLAQQKVFADSLPAFSKLLVTRDNRLWVRRYDAPGSHERTWHVFDPSGNLEGILATPPQLRVTQFGGDYLVGVWTDELDVESVRAYRLLAPRYRAN